MTRERLHELELSGNFFVIVQYGVYGVLGLQLLVDLVTASWFHALFVLLSLPLVLLPWFLVWQYQLRTVRWFVPGLTLFVFLSQLLGSTLGFYLRYHWWDDLLHLSWGMLAVISGFVLLQVFHQSTDHLSRVKSHFFALFAFSFALMTSTIWEVGEFVWDTAFGTDAQQGGWPDTMLDLTTTTIGALMIVVGSSLWMRSRKRLPFIPH